MRAAPPAVEVALGTGLRERSAVALFYALATVAFTTWLVPRLGVQPSPVLTMGAGVLAALVGWLLLPPLRGRLAWDGAGWSHLGRGDAARQPLQAVHLQMDLGHWLLLRVLRPGTGHSAWCGVTAKEAGGAWHALRLALYYRAPLPALSSGSP